MERRSASHTISERVTRQEEPARRIGRNWRAAPGRKKTPQLRAALQGQVRAHPRLILSQSPAEVDAFDEQIVNLNTGIAGRLQAGLEVIERLGAIPGVDRKVAELVVAELGTDMKRFDRAAGGSVEWDVSGQPGENSPNECAR